MALQTRPRARPAVRLGVAVLAMATVGVAALAIVPVAAGTTQKGLTKQKADKRYLGNTTIATSAPTTVAGDTGAIITVLCPGGKQATDGGADSPAAFAASGDDAIAITESAPVLSGSRSIGWTVEVLNAGSPGNPIPVTAQAVCVP